MATTRNATYKQFNGTDWDTVYFKTSAGQVGESSTLYFLRPATHKVNGKSFYGTTHQGITLYATDITLNSSSSITIKGQLDTYDQQIAGLEDMINKLDYASSDHNHDSTYFKLSNVLGYSEFNAVGASSRYEYLDREYAQNNSVILSAGALNELLANFSTTSHGHSNASTSAAGFMSAADKKSLDTLAAFLTDEDTSYIDTLSEMLEVFKTYPEGTDIYTLLSGKVSWDKVLGSQEAENVAELSLIADDNTLVTSRVLMNALDYFAPNDHDHDDVYFNKNNGGTIFGEVLIGTSTNKKSLTVTDYIYSSTYVGAPTLKEGGKALSELYAAKTHTHSNYSTTMIFTGSTTPTGMKSGDIWINY